MARQKYQQGKRQRDLAKKQKREEKLQQRLERKKNPLGAPIGENPEQGIDPDGPAEPLADDEEDDDEPEGEARD